MNRDALNQFVKQYANILLVFIGAAVSITAYFQAIDAPFMSDDVTYIEENAKLAGLQFHELWRLLVEPYNSFFEFLPIRDLSYWIDVKLFGLNPFFFRMHSIFLYLLCLPLVYGITKWLWKYYYPAKSNDAPWIAAVVTTLFALHPSHVEAVVWIAGRKDVLSSLLSLLSIWLSIKAKRVGGLSIRYSVATLIVLLAAMLSKATAIAVAPVIVLIWFGFWRETPSSDRRWYSLLFWSLIILLLAVFIAINFSSNITSRLPLYFGVEALYRSLGVLGWFARLSISPESRHFLYPVFEDPYLPVMVITGGAVIVTAVIAGVMFLFKRSLAGFAVVTFMLLCAPSMSIIPYTMPSLVSDRFIFLAVWPATLLMVVFTWRFRLSLRIVFFVILAFSWGFQALDRSRDWQSFEELIDADLRTYPDFYMPVSYKLVGTQLPLGLVGEARRAASNISTPEFREAMIEMVDIFYVVHAETIKTGNPDKAIELLNQLSLDLKSLPEQAQWNSPVYRFWKKRKVVVENEWRFLAAKFPGNEWVQYNIGKWLLDEQRFQNAITYLRAAIESQRLPEEVKGIAYNLLGISMLKEGNTSDAELPLQLALRQSFPDYQAYCSLSILYSETGRLSDLEAAESNCRRLVAGNNSFR